jgi:cysteine desulfurase / selenocysteine lyase
MLKVAQKFDITQCRADFPVLRTRMNDRPLAYLDTAASAQKPQAVIDAMKDLMELHYANIHRGLYALSQETTTAFETVRGKVAEFINAASEKEIIFTRNATEGINLVAQSWGRTFLKAGDEIILTGMEHHANIVPWQLLRDQIGVVLKIIPVLADGTLDMAAYKKLLSPKTRLVACVHISNALGTVNPVKEITAIAKNHNKDIHVLIDGSQAVVHSLVDMQDIGADFYAFTGHKLYGPTGAGVLWGRYEILAAMPPYQGGGDMIDRVTFEKTTYKEPPSRFEAGTPDIIEVIGLGAALDYLHVVGVEAIAAHEAALLDYATKKVSGIGGLKIHGTAPHRAGIISFTADWGGPSDIGMILDQCGVAVRAGHHCCQPLMGTLGVEATVRASLGLYTNKDDIDALAAGLAKAKELLS